MKKAEILARIEELENMAEEALKSPEAFLDAYEVARDYCRGINDFNFLTEDDLAEICKSDPERFFDLLRYSSKPLEFGYNSVYYIDDLGRLNEVEDYASERADVIRAEACIDSADLITALRNAPRWLSYLSDGDFYNIMDEMTDLDKVIELGEFED